MKIKTTGKKPTANLAINKSRIKKYGKSKNIPSYYLEKGQEFQIELFNPTQGKVLTTIKLNNKPISGGLVLRPGERVFLDRFLDTNKKFLFDTYDVENTKSARKAIEPNGDVEIAFFKEIEEQEPFFNNGSGMVTLDCFDGNVTTTNFSDTTFTSTSSGDLSYNLTAMDQDFYLPVRSDEGVEISASNTTIDGDLTVKGDIKLSGSLGIAPTRSFTSPGVYINESDKSEVKKTKSLKSKRSRISSTPTKIETGRVEKGSTSQQDLREATGDFEMISFHIIKYKLTPKSQKKLTSVDYYSKYCTSCGGRCKTSFCPFCGNKQ